MKRTHFLVLAAVLCLTATAVLSGALDVTQSFGLKLSPADRARIAALLEEMETVDLSKLPAIAVEPFALPKASLDVMRVRLEETYEVNGIGKDTVALEGWIAVVHDNPRPAEGETEVRWGTAVSDTEFVGMNLRGESELFGPVFVSLDRSQPSLGIVGKLQPSMLDDLVFQMGYLPYRNQTTSQFGRGGAAFLGKAPRIRSTQLEPIATQTVTRPQATEAVTRPQVVVPRIRLRGEDRRIQEVLESTLASISRKDARGMLASYSKNPKNVFFNTALKEQSAEGAEYYIRQLSRMFENIAEIRAIAEQMEIRASGELAVATVTGRNDVVDREGNRGSSQWRWTVQLEKEEGNWVITHDHLSFVPSVTQLSNPAGDCVANLTVGILMPSLDLYMKTQYPVQWYSEVETIPPVGYTASVSFTPTPLIAEGRQVATLTHGVVGFREIVRKVSLDGSRF